MCFSSPSHLILPNSVVITMSGEKLRSTVIEAPHYVVFSNPLLPRPSQAQIFSSILYSQTPSAYVPSAISETKSHTHTKQQTKFCFCISNTFPALPDFLSSSGSGTGSTQPREVNWGATWIKKVAAPLQKTEINGRGDPLRWPRDTPLSAKVGTNFAERRRPLCRYSSLAD